MLPRFHSPLDSNPLYARIPRIPTGSAHRRTLFPGLIEYTRDGKGLNGGPADVWLNALQPVAECEALLKKEEKRASIATQGNRQVICETSSVSAYQGRGEDRVCISGVEKARLVKAAETAHIPGKTWWSQWRELESEGEGKDLLFFTIIDGHGGAQICDLLEVAANACIGWAIANDPAAASGEEGAMKQALSDAYLTINQEISAAALDIINKPRISPPDSQLPGMPGIAQLLEGHLERSGACMATAVVDLVNNKLYVANAGDCRVVGVWKEKEKDHWTTEVLTEDHIGFNPAEVARVKAEHPDDPNAMVDSGEGFHRMLGINQSTHVIGDVSINRTESERQLILTQALTQTALPTKCPAVDPPYTLWTPDVFAKDLFGGQRGDLKYLIFDCDGLFEKLTSEETALAVRAHKAHPKHPDIPKAQLPTMFPTVPPKDPRPYPAEPLPGSDEFDMAVGHWMFEDENAATHLIRNGLSRGDRELLREMLSLRNGTRWFRDDITAMVISL